MKFLKTMCLFLIALSGAVDCAQYARKTAAALGTAAYWGCTFGVPIQQAVGERKAEAEIEQQADFVPLVYQMERRLQKEGRLWDGINRDSEKPSYQRASWFAYDELRRLGLPSNTRVRPFYSTCALKHQILVEQNEFWKVEKALAHREHPEYFYNERPDLQIHDDAVINLFKGKLHHEANHLLHGDTNWRGSALGWAAACLPVGLRAAVRMLYGVTSSAKRYANLRKTFSGVLNYLASTQVYFAGSRMIEQQADDAVQDSGAMKEMINDLERVDVEITKACENKPISLWLINNALTHPSPASRAAKFKSRLIEKEAEGRKA